MAKIRRWAPNKDVDATYPYYSRRNEKGEILYSVPIEAPTDLPADACEGAEEIEYSYLPIIGGRNVRVFCWETTDRNAGLMQRSWFNAEHTRDRRRASQEINIAETKDSPDGSVWDSIRETGYEPHGFPQVEKTVLNRIEIEEICELVCSRDPRYWEVFYQVRLYGEDLQTVADRMGISAQRVHQLANKVREIAEKYLKENR